jgi:hypothetical protein
MARFRNLYHLGCLIFLALFFAPRTGRPQSFSRDLEVEVLVSQLGFVPGAQKSCVLPGDRATDFEVVRLQDQKTVFTGKLIPSKGDFGLFSTGDFSALTAPGTYYIKAGPLRSYPFRISRLVYDEALQMIVKYFSLQRCGPSTTGYLAPCHLDDGVRLDTGRHQDTTGGWHDASDLRKWFGATINGMIGLARVYEIAKPAWDRGQILDELRWGNRYFLNMQETAGYVMSHVGGDLLAHGDSCRWTDNIIGPEGGSVVTIDPGAGRSTNKISIIGNKDDRVIQTRPENRAGQYKFIMSEAIMARLTRVTDPDYAKKCLQAAERCYEWCVKTGPDQTTANLGTAIEAAIEMHKTTGGQKYRDFAAASAAGLIKLQVTEPIDQQDRIRGFFRNSTENPEPYLDISNGCWHLIGLCDLIEAFPGHSDARTWREAVRLYAGDYLAAMSRRNHFGIVPYGFFTKQDPGGSRRLGEYWYRYFMHPGGRGKDGWWVGINANLASAGVGLLKASKVLKDSSLPAVAQHQLDWIVGFNPLSSSTIVGIGYNHPGQFLQKGYFYPPTPQLPGAVMNGLGGTPEDQPARFDGSYHTAEYWTPMVAFTMWLMAMLQSS